MLDDTSAVVPGIQMGEERKEAKRWQKWFNRNLGEGGGKPIERKLEKADVQKHDNGLFFMPVQIKV